VIWPESATPFLYEEEPAARDAIQRVLAEHDAYLLLGSDQLERGPSPRFFNAAFLLAPDGRTLGVYRKNRLVPFGEYVPMRDLLFFAAPLVESVGEFAPGDDVSPLAFPQGRLSVAICYEVVFPALARRSVQLGSRLLTTVTNDAWYGDSSAPYQHFEQATLRAVENGRYLVRAANTGISAIVDPYGRVQARSALFETVGFTGHIRLLDGQTVYGKIGDVVAHASLALVLLALIATFRPPTFRAGARR
jgi:apolipoprotein N-acyltransferase